MRPMRFLVGCLMGLALIIAGCGYGDEEPGDTPPATAVSRRPSGPEKRPTSRPVRPTPPTPTPEPQPEPPGPDAVPYDVVYVPPDPGIIHGYLGGALGAARRVKVMTALRSVNQWLEQRKMLGDGFPKDIQELEKAYRRDGGRFETPPPHYRYFYWPKHGVVKMVRVTDERFRDPKHIHTFERRP